MTPHTSPTIDRRHFTSRTGKQIEFTSLGFGSAPLGNLYKAISNAQARESLEEAWSSGLRYFDTAPLYGLGLAEVRVGSFLQERPRDEFVLSTKVGRILKRCAPDARDGIGKFFDVPSRQGIYDYSYDGVV